MSTIHLLRIFLEMECAKVNFYHEVTRYLLTRLGVEVGDSVLCNHAMQSSKPVTESISYVMSIVFSPRCCKETLA